MWNLEKDPHLSASIANVTVLDQPPDRDRLRARMERAVGEHPPPAPAGGAGPRPPGPARVAGRPRLRPRLPPALGGPARPRRRCASCSTSPRRSSTTRSTAPARCGSSWSSRASRAAGPRWSRSCTTRSPTARAAIRLSEQFIDLARDATEPIAPDRPVARAARGRPASTRRSTRSPTTCAAAVGVVRRTAARSAASSGTRAGSPALGSDAVELGRSAVAPARRHRPGPLAAVDRALAAPAPRGARRCPSTRRRPRPRPSAAASTTSSWPPPSAGPAAGAPGGRDARSTSCACRCR